MQLISIERRDDAALTDVERAAIGRDAPDEVRRFLEPCPDYKPTPLASLPALAAEMGVGSVHIKDEGQRLGLLSFKALGGAYAVARLVHGMAETALNEPVSPWALQDEAVRKIASGLTVACATDGNHGRSVAAGARLFGCRCVIFLHEGVSQAREDAIAHFGAEIVRTAGTYDMSVAEAARVAGREGWTVVSDTSWEGYHEIPWRVMQGYTVMIDEALDQLYAPPTHVFVQGGVGGVAAAVSGHLLDRFGFARPTMVVVEPSRANCLQASAIASALTAIEHGEATIMSMLECYEPSEIAWSVLERSADLFLDVPEQAAIDAMRTLAHPHDGDPALVIGESGAAGLAGLTAVATDPRMRERAGLDSSSHVLLFGTEGATDPELYETLVGAALNA